MKRALVFLIALLLPHLALAQQLGYGIAFGLSAASLGAAGGTMASYSVGDTITLSCTQPQIGSGTQFVSFSTSPVVTVTAVSSGAVTTAVVSTTGVTSGTFANAAVACSQASTSGSGTGYTTTAQLVPNLPSVPFLSIPASLPTLSSCGTSPTVAAGSNSNGGRFTMGTASPTACTITFLIPYPTQAYCVVTPASSGGAAITGGYYISAQSKTAFTLTIGTGTSSLVWDYSCDGN